MTNKILSTASGLFLGVLCHFIFEGLGEAYIASLTRPSASLTRLAVHVMPVVFTMVGAIIGYGITYREEEQPTPSEETRKPTTFFDQRKNKQS